MLRISILDSSSRRRVIVEGTLCEPWIEELRSAWNRAHADLQNRTLVIDLENVTAITREGENAILKLMGEGAQFRSRGVLTKHILRELAQQNRKTTRAKLHVVHAPSHSKRVK